MYITTASSTEVAAIPARRLPFPVQQKEPVLQNVRSQGLYGWIRIRTGITVLPSMATVPQTGCFPRWMYIFIREASQLLPRSPRIRMEASVSRLAAKHGL